MRIARLDLFTGLLGAALAAGASAVTQGPLDVATGALLGGALAAARTAPRATWIFAAALFLVSAARGQLPAGDEVAAAGLIAAHCLAAGRWDGSWASGGVLLSCTIASMTASAGDHDAGPFFAIVSIAAWGAGRALSDREAVAARLAQRARELDEEREAHAALSVRYERARIASELHDIVAHAISVMVVQATAGQRLAGRDAELTAETFANLASAARQAESDLGRLVALLGDENSIGEAPDLSLVEELVAHAAGSGLDVTLRLEGEREGLPAHVTEAAYRVVQEGLTNALRYAAGSAVSVLVCGGRDELTVSIENGPANSENPLSGAGTGNGLRGLRERVSECAGTLQAGPTTDGGWRLRAQLPRRAPLRAT